MKENLHQRLREATAPAHHALERDLDWQVQVATRAGYRSMLARFRGFHAAYEPLIGEALGDEPFFGPRRRLAKLDADLTYLGLAASAIEALPNPPPVALEGRAEALGALYVLEGSTLGGQVIGKRISQLHDFDETGGCAYYCAYGRAAGAMWSAFRTELETLSGDREAEEAALRAGTATFEAMRLWLARRAEAAA